MSSKLADCEHDFPAAYAEGTDVRSTFVAAIEKWCPECGAVWSPHKGGEWLAPGWLRSERAQERA